MYQTYDQDSTSSVDDGFAAMELRVSSTDVFDDTQLHTEVVSPDLTDAINNASEAAGDLMRHLIRACEELSWHRSAC